MNELSIYIALYCVLLYTQSTLQSCEVVSPQSPPVCCIHLDDATAATGQRRQCGHHTPATGGEERERDRANQVYALTTHQLQVERRESHRANQVYALMGQWREFGQDTGVTPLLFTRSAMGWMCINATTIL